jgi:carbamoyl-phosphate synthase large subunit
MGEHVKKSAGRQKTWRVLITCVGRRVELVQAFREAGRLLRQPTMVYGTDVSWLAPAMHIVDRAVQIPPIENPRYIPSLLQLVEKQKIDLVVPTIDTDLPKLSAGREKFERLECRILVSPPETVEICQDKVKTFEWLTAAGLSTPATWTYEEFQKRRRFRFPYFIKPRFGSASLGARRVGSMEELWAFAPLVPNPLIQEFAEGVEHTLDVYLGFDGVVKCVVPRRRIDVRWGEVCKGQVVKDTGLMAVGRRVAEALPGPIGVWTVQTMRDRDGRIQVIEINPRFGGGAPLSIAAGAHFPKWLLTELQGRRPRIAFDGFTDGMQMLRYDQSVFGVGLEDHR